MNDNFNSNRVICNSYLDVVLNCALGDILQCAVDAICVSCDSAYSLTTGIGSRLRRAGGHAFMHNLSRTPRNNDIIVVPSTGCGRLCASNVILVPLRSSHRHCMDTVYSSIFECARAYNIQTLALPLLGTGLYGLSSSEGANCMKTAIESISSFTPIKQLHFIDLNKTSLNILRNVLSNLINVGFTNNASTSYLNENNGDVLSSIDPSNSNEIYQQTQQVITMNMSSTSNNAPSGLFGNINEENTKVTTADESSYSNELWTSVSTAELITFYHSHLSDNDHKPIATSSRNLYDDDTMPCAICLCDMLANVITSTRLHSHETINTVANCNSEDIVRLNVCKHLFHEKCIKMAFNVKRQCPLCMNWSAPAEGNQPSGAKMQSRIIGGKVPGHSDANGFHEIRYTIPSGIQTDRHLRPGVPFYGATRVAYLPNNDKGTLTLRLLELAFKRRLIFTVGDSMTSGRKNVVVWNGIHHKTNKHGGAERFGYPDPGYLDRVREELAAIGIHKELLNNE